MLDTILGFVCFGAAPLALLTVSWVWVVRVDRSLRPARRLPFLVGLTASSAAFATWFLLRWYLERANQGAWPGIAVAGLLRVAWIMLAAALAGFLASCLAKSYGRVTGCVSSLLVATLWWATRDVIRWTGG